jgi:hypothetical protein
VRWTAAALVACLAWPALGAVGPEVSVEALARGADAVVRATVLGVEAAWTTDGRHVRTRVTLRRLSTWRGEAPAVVVVEVPGGRVGDVAQSVAGAPEFEPGEEVVVFLRASTPGRFRVLGLATGKFRVAGRQAVPRLEAIHLEEAAIPPGERRVEAMPLEELERRVRAP